MPLPGFEAILREADARGGARSVVAAGGADPTVIEALRSAVARGWARATLVGPEAETRAIASERGITVDGFAFIDVESEAIPAAAVEAIRSGRGEVLIKGRVSTPDLMAAISDPAGGIRAGRVVAQVVLMEILPRGRCFLLTDTGIVVAPKLPTKVEILRDAVAVARALGLDRPNVAIMAATEAINPAMPETLHAAELQRRNEEGEFPDCIVRGPLAFDLAYDADAGAKKRVGGPVVGAADVMIFPGLAAANLTVKAIMYTADCRFGGVLTGTVAPVAFMSRSDSTATRLRSLALALALPTRSPEPA